MARTTTKKTAKKAVKPTAVEETAPTETTAPVVATESSDAPTLGLADLGSVVTLIDLCTQRGAFRGEELQDIGTLRGKFVAFLQATQKAQEEAPKSE